MTDQNRRHESPGMLRIAVPNKGSLAETAAQMRKDLITAGGKAYKNHRVFRRAV